MLSLKKIIKINILITFIVFLFLANRVSAQFTKVTPGTIDRNPVLTCSGSTTLRTNPTTGKSLCCVSLSITPQFCQEYCSGTFSGWQGTPSCSDIKSCQAKPSTTPYPDYPTANPTMYCYQSVIATYQDGTTYEKYVSWDGVTPEQTSLASCKHDGQTYLVGNYCPIGGSEKCLPLNSQDSGSSTICCKQNGTINITEDATKCDVAPKKCPSPEADYHLLNGNVCCKKPTDATISSSCSGLGKTDCKVNDSSYSYSNLNLGCLTSTCKCTVDIVSASDPSKKVNVYTDTGTPNIDPDGGNVPVPDPGNTNPDTTPIIKSACEPKAGETEINIDNCVKETCGKYVATLDPSKRATESESCYKCYSSNTDVNRPLYQWTAIGCVNVSTQGLIVNILRIFYGIGTGLLVFRIVTAGLKLLNEPDNPGVMKDSREEITASIFAFIFGVMSVVILRFFGINVLGLTWLENLFPVIG